jgi:hypothetical protein
MTDLREQVARAIRQADVDFFEQEGSPPLIASELNTEGVIEFTEALADAALAVAEPIIRAQVLSELAQKAETEARDWYAIKPNHITGNACMMHADWLRAQADEPDDRKIYIGFKQKDKDRD